MDGPESATVGLCYTSFPKLNKKPDIRIILCLIKIEEAREIADTWRDECAIKVKTFAHSFCHCLNK